MPHVWLLLGVAEPYRERRGESYGLFDFAGARAMK